MWLNTSKKNVAQYLKKEHGSIPKKRMWLNTSKKNVAQYLKKNVAEYLKKRTDLIELIESILTRALYIPIHFALSQHFSFFPDKKFFELLDNPREINGHAGHYIHQVNWQKNGMFPLKIKKSV